MMGTWDRIRVVGALALGVLLTAPAGCGSDSARYVPTMDLARESLEAALTSWRDGRPIGSIEGSSPPVRVVDLSRGSGEKLATYQVLGEADVDGRKEFTVRLTMRETRSAKEARYVVHGTDPIWVYRAEEFARAMDMDNQPEPPHRKPRQFARSLPGAHLKNGARSAR
jgi:hypothetical protein